MKRNLFITTILAAVLLPVSLMAQPSAGYDSLFEQLQERVDSATGQLAVVGNSLEQVGERLPRLETRPAVVSALTYGEKVARPQPAKRTLYAEASSAEELAPTSKKSFLKRKKASPLGALKEREKTEGRDSNMGLFTMGSFLLAIVLFALWMKKRKGQSPASRKAATIETIATSRLFGKHAISLVRVPGQILVLGASDKGMTLLTQLDEATFDQSMAAEEADPGAKSGFSQRLQSLCEGFQPSASAHETMDRKEQLRRALNDSAPVDQLLVSDERSAIRQRLSAMRGKA